jgi:hypothetical protein
MAMSYLESAAIGAENRNGLSAGIEGGVVTFDIISDKDGAAGKALLSVSIGVLVNLSKRPQAAHQSFSTFGDSTLSLPLASGTSFVLSTLNVKSVERQPHSRSQRKERKAVVTPGFDQRPILCAAGTRPHGIRRTRRL